MYVTAFAATAEYVDGKKVQGKGKRIRGMCFPTEAVPAYNGYGFAIRLAAAELGGSGSADRTFSVTLDETTIKLILRTVALHKPELDPHHDVVQAAIALLTKPVVEPPAPNPSRPLSIKLATLEKK